MKKQTKKYSAILILAALTFLFVGESQTRAQFVAKTDAPQDLRDGKAIEYLKRTGSYDSLSEALKEAKSAETPAALDLLFIQRQKLLANDGAIDDNFGRSVAISGDTAVIGAYLDNVGSHPDQGSAYVFVRSGTTWTQQQKLTASDGAGGDRFGNSLDLALTVGGAFAVIGADNDDVAGNSDQGSAYVFTRSGSFWTQQQKLTANDGAQVDNFGHSVTINLTIGNTIVVGADVAKIGNNEQQGAAYVFKRDGSVWT